MVNFRPFGSSDEADKAFTRAVNKTRIGLLGSDRIVDRIGLRIGSDRIGLAMRLKFPPKWSRDIPRTEDGGEKSMYTIFCN